MNWCETPARGTSTRIGSTPAARVCRFTTFCEGGSACASRRTSTEAASAVTVTVSAIDEISIWISTRLGRPSNGNVTELVLKPDSTLVTTTSPCGTPENVHVPLLSETTVARYLPTAICTETPGNSAPLESNKRPRIWPGITPVGGSRIAGLAATYSSGL